MLSIKGKSTQNNFFEKEHCKEGEDHEKRVIN